MNASPTTTDHEALAATALAAAGRGGDELLFLAGSTTDGLANRNSDLDLYVVGDCRVAGSETAARQGERTATVAYHEGREVNVAVLEPAGLDRLREAFRAAVASLAEERGIAQLVDEDNLKILHRVRTGVALRRPDRLQELRDDLGTDDLPRYLLNVAAVAAVNRLTDVAGELADGHADSAAWMYREALVHTGQCALAAAGVTVPSVKWLVRLLQRETAAAGDTAFTRCADHTARHLLAPPADTAAAVTETRAALAAVLDAAGDRAGAYVRLVARPKLG
ncbi:nucleotidyltransferase domain-containing protein [Streptomyces sp. BYX5S]